ncbi:hypothetical protein [Agaribacter flavus]|uniref:NOMO second beta-sandwich domain-containing protein n=1 Tax=Agaribacter flavus TaxID=1902781 RepID=A0ABV7FQ64_9ALTE
MQHGSSWKQFGKGLPLFFVLTIFLFVYAPLTNACQTQFNWQKVKVNEDDVLFMVVRVNNRPVLDSVDVYAVNDTHLVAISQLPEGFNLPWRLSFEPYQLWSEYDETSPLSCDFVVDFTTRQETETAYWYADDFDIYVDIKVIAKLLEGIATTNYEVMQLNFTSSYERFGLRDRNQSVANERSYTPLETMPLVADEYQLFTLPRLNYRLDARRQDKKSSIAHSAHLNAYFDLAYMAADYRLSNTKTDTRQFLRLSKNFLIDDSFTDYKQSLETINDRSIKYEFGDISLQGDELVSTSLQGLGFNTFSFSQNKRRNFSTIRIEETVLPGWQARLFRNGEFLEEAESNDNNQVVFLNVPTFFGRNEFEISLLGPEGQEETRTQIVNVGQEQLPAGSFDFRVYAADAAQRLLDGKILDKNERQIGVSGLVGIGHNTTLSTDFQRIEQDSGFVDYGTLGLDMRIGDHAIRVRHANQFSGGYANFFGINSRISKNISANVQHTSLHNFTSNKFRKTIDFTQETKARLSVKLGDKKPFTTNANLSRKQRKDGSRQVSAALGVSQNHHGNTYSTKLSYSENKGTKEVVHDIFVSQRLGNTQISHSLLWQPFDRIGIDSYQANIRWPNKLRSFQQTHFSYRANNAEKFTLRHQASWRHKLFNLKVGASIDSGGHWNVNMGISGDLYYNKPKRRLQLSRPRGATAASIDAFAYLDRNRDGHFNNDDEALAEVGFEGSHNWAEKLTEKNGRVQLFTHNRYQEIGVDESSLHDPFTVPAKKPVLVATHEGGAAKVAFPVVSANDIEGAIIQEKQGESRGLAGLTVKLLEINGSNHYTSMTEVDGFFFFTKVPPGKYLLQLDENKLNDFKLAKPENPIYVVAPEEGDIVSIDDIVLIGKKEQNIEALSRLKAESAPYNDLQKLAFLALKPAIQRSLDAIKYTRIDKSPLLAFNDLSSSQSFGRNTQVSTN